MHVFYSPLYEIDLGLHVFPTRKYRLVHDRLLERGLIASRDVVEPATATWEDLGRVHTADYLTKMRTGAMSIEDLAQLELPWSAGMVEGFRVMVGGTIDAALIACGITTSEFRMPESELPIACHIGGGLHHAFPNHGEGFCPFNDVAVAIRVLQARGIERHAVIDLDVHHGNGTAFIFNPGGATPPLPTRSDRSSGQRVADAAVFTFSIHQQHNYPMWKPRGSLDIGLPDGAHDDTYLRELETALPRALAHAPECVFYLAGADPYEDDQLGGLRLTMDGLRARDRMVIEAVRHARVPLVIVLAGGYARRVDDTVAIHAATIEEAANAS